MSYLCLDLYAEKTRPSDKLTVDGYPIGMMRLKLIDWMRWERELLQSDDIRQNRTEGYLVQILFSWFRNRLDEHYDDLVTKSITNIATFDTRYPEPAEDLEDAVHRSNYRYLNVQNIIKAGTFVQLERSDFKKTNRFVTIPVHILKSLLDDCEKVIADPEQAFFLFNGDGEAEKIAKIINKNPVVEMCKFTQPRLAKILEDANKFDRFFISSYIEPYQEPGF